MLRAAEDQPDPEGPGAVVLLLDWFQLDQELLLVQERPDASVDLRAYMRSKGSTLQEQEAKVCGGQPGWGFSSAFMGLQGGDNPTGKIHPNSSVLRCIYMCSEG